MCINNTLGEARRARRVDDVCRILRVDFQGRALIRGELNGIVQVDMDYTTPKADAFFELRALAS